MENTYRPLLEAVSFAARAHQGQMRKDGKTPYASHVFRVCLILRHVFGIDDGGNRIGLCADEIKNFCLLHETEILERRVFSLFDVGINDFARVAN